jgi:formate--tetrahydrofolate ligase
MPASQHSSPKTDIAIAQEAKMRPILEVAKEKLGIAPENLDPYGHYKAKVSMSYIKSLSAKKNGKLILVSAWASPTRSATSARRRCSACASPRSDRRSA